MTQEEYAGKDFHIDYLQVMNEEGEIINEELFPKLSDDDVRTMYWHMINARALDRKMLTLQRQGRLGTFASIEGQEACQVGPAMQLKKTDWLVQAFRENTACLVRDIPMLNILQYWGGDERGSRVADDQRTLPVSIPVGSQPLHAVGLGYAAMIQGKDEVALAYFGDGATSEGEFHEAMNLAGVYQTPTILICQNNQYAISVPREKQTHSQTIAQKAIAYGVPGIQVDGNDAFAMYAAAQAAIARARAGKGSTLIEAVTYRLGNHTTSDDYKKYRQEEEVEAWRKKDPVDRLRKYMEKNGLWDEEHEQSAQQHAQEIVEAAVKEYEQTEAYKNEDIFDYLYEELPPLIKKQREEFLKEVSR
ncbi:MAG: pyruvate dehydrogenase (acetyl-transferring) E1 component subunit alpha [Candidatus Woesearchaeota archaeon]